MEKNKGLFSIRKHPVGNFSDRKKGRKRKGGRLRQGLAMLLAAALVGGTMPASGLTVSASGREAELCEHHTEHDADCGYIPKSEDGEGSPCTYECRICPIEDLIAALPDKVTKRNEFRLDHAEDVRAQLEEILALYGELNEDEQEQIDLSRCYALQEALDNANAPMTVDGSTEQQDTDEASVTINGETLYYATLEEAFAAANGKNATITMLTDAECTYTDSKNPSPLPISKGNVTLDMNGKTLTGKSYGTYGIVDVSGGSLSVQGEGKIMVINTGLFCKGNGKLTAKDITLELVTGQFYAISGVQNNGGTVILNGVKMTGAASDGQIHQYSGNTTINDVTATGTVESHPNSVLYYNEGTLTINGGTFDKISVDSGNYGGVQSVAELLGEGRACRKQDGSWATADELAVLEISNVSVEEIPLTIQPQGDISWYYGSPHTLAMNAAPVNGDHSVTYVWKNGETTLDCSEDACTVPADTPVGSYTYTCEATCDGYTLSHTFTFKIEQSGTEFTGGIKTYNGSEETTGFAADDIITVKAAPTAAGTAPAKAAARLRGGYAAPTAGQMALFVGDVQVSEPVQAGADGIYTMTVSAAEVLLQGNAEPNGNAVTLTTKFVGNDNMADAAGTVDVKISAVAMAEKDGEVIGYFGVSNFEGSNNLFFQNAYTNATITLLEDVKPSTNSETGTTCSTMVNITCALDLAGHNFASTDTAIYVLPGGNLTIQDSSTGKTGNVSFIKSDGTLTLYGGTFGKIENAYTLSGLLAENCAYYKGSTPILLSGLEGQKELTGPVTVQECQHKDVTPTSNNDGTHTLSCPYCGYSEDAEDCTYDTRYTHDDTSHTQTCMFCGGTKAEAHTIALSATADNNVITVRKACDICGYSEGLGSVVFTFENLTYKNPDAKVSWTKDGPEALGVALKIDNADDYAIQSKYMEYSCHLTDLFGSDPVTVGDHILKVLFYDDSSSIIGRETIECELPFKVAPAPLTDSMVTLSAESADYNGQEQKPTLTVRHGETTLTEGAGYEVSYTRDGAATTDFTSAGTVTITITGKGNYGGMVTKQYTVIPATPTIAWGSVSQELTYTGISAAITEPAVTLVNHESFGGTISYSYRKEGETVYTDGLPIDAGTYTVKAHVDAEGNYAAADSTNELALTITKADAEITVGSAAYKVNYGDPAFTIIGVTDTNSETAVQYAVTEGTDVVSVSNGTVTIKNAGTATITVSLPETANYNAAEDKTITVNVAKKGGYAVEEVNKKHYYNKEHTAGINLAALLPKDCGTITYGTPSASGNVTYHAAPAVNDGELSYTLNKGNEGDTGTVTVTITTRNYENITVTVNITLIGQIPVALKEGTKVTLAGSNLTYGESLSKLEFNKAVFVDDEGNPVEGSLAWKDASEIPNAGTISAAWVFTPSDQMYMTAEGTAEVTVDKAIPDVFGIPTAAGRVYHPSVTLQDEELSVAAVKVTGVNGALLEGKWGWQDRDIVPAVGNSGYAAVFTPADVANYKTVTKMVTVDVTKAVPYLSVPPTAAGITYGEALKDSALSGGIAVYGNGAGQAGNGTGSMEKVAGMFTWKEPFTKPAVADSNQTEYTIVFTPSDTVNYSSVETKGKLTVNKPQPTPTVTPGQTEPPTPTGIPGQTESPTPTGTPGQTENPTPTGTPGQTEPPTPTGTPGQTEPPTPTVTPGQTEYPTPTGVPGQTEQPTPTGRPGQTENPTPTGTPGQTEPPMPTGIPGQTEPPASTGKAAEPTKKPQGTVTPEEMRKNSEKLDSSISIEWNGNQFALSWEEADGAEGYDIFAAPYGKKLNKKSLVKTVKKGKTSVSLTKIAGKKLSGKNVYSVRIKAWKYVDGKKVYIGSSSTYHVAGKANKKYTNAKKLKPEKKEYVLKKGKSVSIQVTVVKQAEKKKLLPASYGPALQYRSDHQEIATVTRKGRIKAKKKGTCYITVTALNGVRTKIKVTVK